MPAINAVVSARLACKQNAVEDLIASTGEHFAIITSEAPEKAILLLVPEDASVTLFQALRNRDAFALPCVIVESVYKNLLGASFFVRQAYHLTPSHDVEAEIRSWHEAILSFSARFQEDLKAFADAKARSGSSSV